MAFEVYKPRGEKAPKQPLVSLSKNSIVLNKISREKLKAEVVELAFDNETNTLGLKPQMKDKRLKRPNFLREVSLIILGSIKPANTKPYLMKKRKPFM